MEQQAAVRQRRELTFKHNAGLGRHGWLRLTPAYSVRVVEDILGEESGAQRVLDPFCGTGTTALAAANRGILAYSVDINPFLVWLGTLKTRIFTQRELSDARAAFTRAIRGVSAAKPVEPPPIHNIERWWPVNRLRFLRQLKARILAESKPDSIPRDLLMVAFCRSMIGLSNAAFNHQSMSFKVSKADARISLDLGSEEDDLLLASFRRDGEMVLESAAENPRSDVTIAHDDSRRLKTVKKGSFDVLVTSPPYPNRMSYIRELRPYMYWTGFLNEAREAGELDWQAIGGTWGVATSRLTDWSATGPSSLPKSLLRSIRSIEESGAQNAALLARYVAKYFHDMAEHIAAVATRIRPGGRVHYIIGNSTFYGVVVSAETAFADLLLANGFSSVDVRLLRKRNSKKELFEYDVLGTKA